MRSVSWWPNDAYGSCELGRPVFRVRRLNGQIEYPGDSLDCRAYIRDKHPGAKLQYLSRSDEQWHDVPGDEWRLTLPASV